MEIKALTARKHRRRDFMKLRRRKNKDDMLRRLLQGFEQRIECRNGKHMDLIYDIDAVPKVSRRINHAVAQVADVVDTVVAGGIHFNDIRRAPRVDGKAGRAFPTGIPVFGMLAVRRLGDDFRAGGLSRAARPAEEIRMRNFPVLNLAFQNGRDMLLAHNIVEHGRTPFAVKRLIHENSSSASK